MTETFAFRCKMSAVLRLEERLAEVEAEILRIVASSPKLSERMSRLTCIHGVGKVSAFVSATVKTANFTIAH